MHWAEGIDAARLMAVTDATWPPAEIRDRAGWRLRRGDGGGKRVSAASALPGAGLPDPGAAAAAMADWGQPPLFRLTDAEGALSAHLGAAGYRVLDPVTFYAAPVAGFGPWEDETARLIRVVPALALLHEIWEAGGIGAGRQAVMDRPTGQKTRLMARLGDRGVAAAFVAIADGIAMIHAIEVLAGARRRGMGALLLRGAARWAEERGATVLALAVSDANAAAAALYESLGMAPVARYHYRIRAEGPTP